MESDPTGRLAALMTDVTRHREAAREYRGAAYPEIAQLHELELRALYSQIRQLCQQHGLVLPRDIPRE